MQALGFAAVVEVLFCHLSPPYQLKHLPEYSTHLPFSFLHSWNCCFAVCSVVGFLYCCSNVRDREGKHLGVMMVPVEVLGVHRKVALDASRERTAVVASNVRHTHSNLHHREAEVPSKLLLLLSPVTSSRKVLFRNTLNVQ